MVIANNLPLTDEQIKAGATAGLAARVADDANIQNYQQQTDLRIAGVTESVSIVVDGKYTMLFTTTDGTSSGNLYATYNMAYAADLTGVYADDIAIAFAEGFDRGFERGYDEGYKDGYRDGFADGVAHAQN